jgi:hypothetical protein
VELVVDTFYYHFRVLSRERMNFHRSQIPKLPIKNGPQHTCTNTYAAVFERQFLRRPTQGVWPEVAPSSLYSSGAGNNITASSRSLHSPTFRFVSPLSSYYIYDV